MRRRVLGTLNVLCWIDKGGQLSGIRFRVWELGISLAVQTSSVPTAQRSQENDFIPLGTVSSRSAAAAAPLPQ